MKALTPKQEKFAQGVASGKTQADAYRAAYNANNMKDSTIWKKASLLMIKGEVRGRVEELKKVAAKSVGITLASHLGDLLKLRNMAAKNKQFGPAIAAEVARGKISGIEKTNEKTSDDFGMAQAGSSAKDVLLSKILTSRHMKEGGDNGPGPTTI
jgi:hypothetical protein